MIKRIFGIFIIIMMIGSMTLADSVNYLNPLSAEYNSSRINRRVSMMLNSSAMLLAADVVVIGFLKLIFFLIYKNNGKFEKLNKVLKVLLIISSILFLLTISSVINFKNIMAN